jgi:hypothetical protein
MPPDVVICRFPASTSTHAWSTFVRNHPHGNESRRADRGLRPGGGLGHDASGSIPNRSFTALRSFCLQPR